MGAGGSLGNLVKRLGLGVEGCRRVGLGVRRGVALGVRGLPKFFPSMFLQMTKNPFFFLTKPETGQIKGLGR